MPAERHRARIPHRYHRRRLADADRIPSIDQPPRILDGRGVGFGLTLGDFFRLQARAELKNYAPITAKADSVIHIFLPGGIAHQETFDPKPFAPIEYRGEMGSIPTKIDGESFCETLPQTAQIADKITVIRSMTHGEAAHERGTHNMFTGYRPSPALQYPEHGQRGLPRVRARRTTCRPTSASRASPTSTRARATSARRSRRSAWGPTRPTPASGSRT